MQYAFQQLLELTEFKQNSCKNNCFLTFEELRKCNFFSLLNFFGYSNIELEVQENILLQYLQALAQVPFCRKALEILYKYEMVNKLNSHTCLYYSIVEGPL
jgi:hypothetical protein